MDKNKELKSKKRDVRLFMFLLIFDLVILVMYISKFMNEVNGEMNIGNIKVYFIFSVSFAVLSTMQLFNFVNAKSTYNLIKNKIKLIKDAYKSLTASTLASLTDEEQRNYGKDLLSTEKDKCVFLLTYKIKEGKMNYDNDNIDTFCKACEDYLSEKGFVGSKVTYKFSQNSFDENNKIERICSLTAIAAGDDNTFEHNFDEIYNWTNPDKYEVFPSVINDFMKDYYILDGGVCIIPSFKLFEEKVVLPR